MRNILEEITRLRLERGWSEYDLSKKSGIPQSTISTWYRRNQSPTVHSLEKICAGFGITLSRFFAEGNESIALNPKQKEMLDQWSSLNETQQELFLELFKSI